MKTQQLIEEQFVPIWFAHIPPDIMPISYEAFMGPEEVEETVASFSNTL